jgi:hypothetical protein
MSGSKEKTFACAHKKCHKRCPRALSSPLPFFVKGHNWYTMEGVRMDEERMLEWRLTWEFHLEKHYKKSDRVCLSHFNNDYVLSTDEDAWPPWAKGKRPHRVQYHRECQLLPINDVSVLEVSTSNAMKTPPVVERGRKRRRDPSPSPSPAAEVAPPDTPMDIVGAAFAKMLAMDHLSGADRAHLVDQQRRCVELYDQMIEDYESRIAAQNTKIGDLEELIERLKKSGLTYDSIKAQNIDGGRFRRLCGMPSRVAFELLFEEIDACFSDHDLEIDLLRLNSSAVQTLKKARTANTTIRGARAKYGGRNILFMTLFILRQNMGISTYATIAGVQTSTMSNYFYCGLNVLRTFFELRMMHCTREFHEASYPPDFKAQFRGRDHAIILDSTNVQIAVPTDKQAQRVTWSSYYGCNSGKYNIGINPQGHITYVSNVYPASIGDAELTTGGYLHEANGDVLIGPGQFIMADKGYNIRDYCAALQIGLEMPPIKETNVFVFAKAQLQITRNIANQRIHIERAVRRNKEWSIVKGPVHYTMNPVLNDIIFVTAMLCNFGTPLCDSVSAV